MRRTSVIREALDRLNIIEDDTVSTVLDEDLKGYFKNNYLKKFCELMHIVGPEQQVNKKAYPMMLAVAKIDPTFKGKEIEDPEEAMKKDKGSYFDWLMRLLTKGVLTYDQLMSEAQELNDRLGAFEDLKKNRRLPADKRDIMQFKNPEALQELIVSLGADIEVDADAEKGTSFKSAVKNIRGALISICGFHDEDIPSDIKHTEDALTLLCENSKWEVWKINSVWGAMLTDTFGIDWGAGATWCTGGQYGFRGSPRKGKELLSSAEGFYPNYTHDKYLVDFIQKDTSVKRPQNAAQLNVDNDNYGVSNFFHSNDSGIGLDADGKITYSGYRYGQDTAEVLAVFLQQEGLLDAIKGTILGSCEAVADAENKDRLEKGEPYIYGGGKIKDMFRSSIKKIIFEYNGEKFEVDAVEHPEYLQATTVNEMFNIKELSEGKPYTYDGTKIPDSCKEAIRQLIFADGDAYKVTPKDLPLFKDAPETFFAIPNHAFKGCTNIETITLPKADGYCLGFRAFESIPDTAKVIFPRDRNQHSQIKVQPSDNIDKLKKIFYYDDGELVVKPAKEEK